MADVLAVDLGKTGCRAALYMGAERLEAEGPGAPGLAAQNGISLAQASVLDVARPLLRQAGLERVASVAIGMGGATAAPAAARMLAEQVMATLPAEHVAITSDAVATHAGALAGEPGCVLAIGTGSVAIAVGPDGAFARIDGWGPLLGDDGGSAWLGLAGLRAALRAADGRGPATCLREAATRFGPLAGLPALIEADENPARLAAGFAWDVARAAEAGDAVARSLLAQAARELAVTARAAASRVTDLDPVPLVLTGNLLGIGPALTDPLRAELAAGPARMMLHKPSGDARDGAHLLASRTDTVHEARVLQLRKQAGIGCEHLNTLATEAVRPGLDDLDQRPVTELVHLLISAEGAAHAAILRAAPQLAAAAERIAQRLEAGGRLFYVGAGTPGRLAMLDAAELGPTFSAPPDLVIALLAGGEAAMVHAAEGAEDDTAAAGLALRAHGLATGDAVVGIAASGRTPYVVGALRDARAAGALTVAIVNNPASPAAATAELVVELLTGPEVIAGSTRLTAGTTQKIVLNTLSTAVMVRLGKTYGARMVDVRATNEKLRRRALRMVREITGADEADAARALAAAGGRVKPAIVALLRGCDTQEAERLLKAAGGRVRAALADAPA